MLAMIWKRVPQRGLVLMIFALAWALAACAQGPTPTPTAQSAMTTPTITQARYRTPTPVTKDVLDLGQALAQGLVEARISGNGASSGDSIIVELTRKVPRPLELFIPVGTVLRSQDPAAQNMVVLGVRGVPIGGGKFQPTSTIRLTSDAPREFLLEAYCLDFDKGNPSGSTGFSVGELAAAEIRAVFEALEKVPAAERTIGAIQTAIWVVTEDVCERDLLARFQVNAADVKAALVILEAAGIDPTTTCLSGRRGAGLPQKTRVLPTDPPKAILTPVLTMALPTPVRPTVTLAPVLPTETPAPLAPIPTAAKAGTSITGDVWQVTVTSVSRMKRLECGSGADKSTHRPSAGYELLEATVEFAPMARTAEMSVSTENVALIGSDGNIEKALGGGKPSQPAVSGRRSSSCCLSGSGSSCVVESYLVRDTLTTSFFFAVGEGRKGYEFQFMDYPPIPLNE